MYDVTIDGPLHFALFDIRGAREAVTEWCGPALPPLPGQPLTTCKVGEDALLRLGPERWLLLAPLAREEKLAAILRPDAAPGELSIVEISDTMIFFEINGPDAAEVMAVASPLDIRPDRFGSDSATLTEAFGSSALVQRTTHGFRIGWDISYGDMVADCLVRTAG